jgi:hypothetical protein
MSSDAAPHDRNFSALFVRIPRFDLGLVVQNHVQKGIMDLDFSVVFDKTRFAEFVHEEAHTRSARANHLGQDFLTKHPPLRCRGASGRYRAPHDAASLRRTKLRRRKPVDVHLSVRGSSTAEIMRNALAPIKLSVPCSILFDYVDGQQMRQPGSPSYGRDRQDN